MKVAEILKRYQAGERDFCRLNLCGQSFQGQNLSGANFSECDIRGANFTNAILKNTQFCSVEAGLQRRWAMTLVLSSWLMSALAGIFSGITGSLLAAIISSSRFISNGGLTDNVLSLIVLIVFISFTIRPGLVAGALAIAGAGALIIAFALAKIVPGLFIIALAIAVAVAFSFAEAGAGAVAGAFVVALAVVEALIFAVLFPVVEASFKAFYAHIPLTFTATVGSAVAPVFTLAVAALIFVGAFAEAIAGAIAGAIAIVEVEAEAEAEAAAVAVAVGFAGAYIFTVAGAINFAKAINFSQAFTEPGFVGRTLAFAGALVILNGYVGWRALAGNEKDAWVRSIAIAIAAMGGTSFRGADLSDADFTKATLKSTDFRNANLTRTCFRQTKSLDRVRPGTTYLQKLEICNLLSTGQGQDKNFECLNLRGINLKEANLADASFIGSDLSEANLQSSDLSRANFKQTQLDETDFTGATITDAYIEDWGITRATKFDRVRCEYVYMRVPTKQNPDPLRKPDDNNEVFQDGEFGNFIKPL